MPKTTWIAIALLVTAALPAGAESGHEDRERRAGSAALYKLDQIPRPPVEGWLAVPGAAEEFLLSGVDPEVIAADPQTVTFDLPFGPTVEAVRTRFVEYRDDWKSWFGTMRISGTGDRTTGYVYLGYHGEQLTGLIDFRGEHYRIAGGLAGAHRLVRLSEHPGTLTCGTEERSRGGVEETSAPELEHAAGRLFLPPPETGSEPDGVTPKTHFPARLDVLALFPKAYFAFPTSEVSLINFVQDSIALANDAFSNSGIYAFYNLLYVGPLVGPQPPSTGLFDGINWLNTDPSEVVSLRNAFGADIVTLFIPFIWDAQANCGVANLPYANGTHSGTSQLFSQRAFTANRDGCGLNDFTLAHEIGHNYGMRHETGTTGSTHLFPNGRGHQFLVNGQPRASLMACTCGGSGEPACVPGSQATCDRIPNFSDPLISYSGVPTGTSTRNNAAVGRSQVGPYSSFRPVSSNTPPNASFTVSCTGSACTFDASGSTDNTTIPSGGYHWDFGDGTTGSGKIANHTYSFGSFFWVHLVVTDSGGQEDFTLSSASF